MRTTSEIVTVNGHDGAVLLATLDCREDVECAFRVLLSCPHPFLGGTPDNPVMLALRQGLSSAAATSLTWSYRALSVPPVDNNNDVVVAGREAFWQDERLHADQRDLRDCTVVRHWLERERLGSGGRRAMLAGYSYGALVSLASARAGDHLFLVSPPLRALPAGWTPPPGLDVTLVYAEDDLALTFEELAGFANRWPDIDMNATALAGTDHFFLERASDIERAAEAWIVARTTIPGTLDCGGASLGADATS